MANAEFARSFKWLKSAAGALLGYVSGDGSEVEMFKKGTLASRPAASVYNVGMEYFADDENGGTLYKNFNGIAWQQIAVGLNYATGVQLYVRDTYANIVASTGSYVGQRAFCSDFGVAAGAQLQWNGSVWIWAPGEHVLKYQGAAVTAPADTNENTLFTYTLPKLGANDSLVFHYFFTYTSSANTKTLRVKLDSSNGISNAYTNTSATTNGIITVRNRNNASSQAWFSSGKIIYGDATQALTTTAKALGTAGVVFSSTGTKTLAGETITLEFGELRLVGGGTA